MLWFKHLVDSGDDPDIGTIMSKFGSQGYYMFFRTLEIMGREFDIRNPGKNTFNFEWLLGRYRCRIGAKTLQDFFKLTTKLKRIKCRINRDKIFLYCPKLKELADEYTNKQLKKLGIESGQESGQNPSQRSRNKNKKEDIKKKNTKKKKFTEEEIKAFEAEFESLWKNYHPDGKKNKDYAKKRFIALCKQGKLEGFKKGYAGYANFLRHKELNENFEQRPKYFSTLVTDYEEYIGFKYEPRL